MVCMNQECGGILICLANSPLKFAWIIGIYGKPIFWTLGISKNPLTPSKYRFPPLHPVLLHGDQYYFPTARCGKLALPQQAGDRQHAWICRLCMVFAAFCHGVDKWKHRRPPKDRFATCFPLRRLQHVPAGKLSARARRRADSNTTIIPKGANCCLLKSLQHVMAGKFRWTSQYNSQSNE